MGCSSSSAKAGDDFHDEYIVLDKLGEGSFAKVFKCQHRQSNERSAVKVLDVAQSHTVRHDARREAQLLRRIDGSSSCVNLVNFFENKWFCYLVMEQCNCTVLEAFLQEEDTTEDELSHCFRGMLEGLHHIHSRQVVHRDIKPDNFLLEVGTTFSKDSVVKLCDFGLAATTRNGQAGGTCGTAPYMSPEMLIKQKEGYGTKVDIWAMGVSTYLMLFGDFPYRPVIKGSEGMMAVIREGKQAPSYEARDGFPQPSKMACDFVRKLLNRSAKSRPDAALAQQDVFISRLVCPTSETVVHKAVSDPSPESLRRNTRNRSFRQTLKNAQDVANQQYPLGCPPDMKSNFEKALMELQTQQGITLRKGMRTMSYPTTRLSEVRIGDLSGLSGDDTGRSNVRHSTHSGSFYLVMDKNEEADDSDTASTRASSTSDTANDSHSKLDSKQRTCL